MKIGIISDVHDNLRTLSRIIEYLNKEKVELVIHCGDWDMPFTLKTMAQINCPVRAVLGNGDPDIQKFKYQMQNEEMLKNLDLDLKFRFQDFEVEGKRIAVFHGDDKDLNNMIIESQLYDVFCLGHTHQPEIKREGKTLVINPGSLVGYFAETGVRPITFAMYNSETDKAQIMDFEELGLNS